MGSPHAAAPARTDTAEYDAVLVAGFGGPGGPDDVMPFLRNVTRGRGVPDERLAVVAEHYLALGGVSPITAQTEALRQALAAELAARGIDVPVLVGHRNWAPYLADTLTDAAAHGISRVLGVATSAYSSYSSCRQYREDFGRALVDAGLVGRMRIDKVRAYGDTAGFLDPFVDGLAAALAGAAGAGLKADRIQILFTTHSIPLAMADASGGAEDGRLYVQQHLAACAEVMSRLTGRANGVGGAVDGVVRGAAPRWRLVYQSRSGSPAIPWLEPDICDVITGLADDAAADGVIVVPIGFVSDHMEVIWDLDTEAAAAASERGLFFRRVATPGVDTRFVTALADLVTERLRPGSAAPLPSVTGLAARPASCPPGCCRSRTIMPTTAGDDSAVDWADTGFTAADLAASGISGTLAAL